jgi:hypothetical protein
LLFATFGVAELSAGEGEGWVKTGDCVGDLVFEPDFSVLGGHVDVDGVVSVDAASRISMNSIGSGEAQSGRSGAS